MKQIILMLLLVMFAVNGFAATAWAGEPCTQHTPHQVTTKTNMAATGKPDCHQAAGHEKQHTKSAKKHCDGLCLCLHMAHFHTPFMGTDLDKNHIILPTSLERVFQNTVALSTTLLPLKEPPKTLS